MEQIGHEPANRAEHRVGGIGGALQHFFDAGAEAFLTSHQFFEHRGPLRRAAVTLPQFRQLVLLGRLALSALGKLLLGVGQPPGLLLRFFGPVCAAAAQLVQLLLQHIKRAVEFGNPIAATLASGGGGGHLALQGAAFVAQRGRSPHLLHVRRASLFVFAAKMIERSHDFRQGAFGLDQSTDNVLVILFGLLQR